jgi:hypothetical protein
LNLEGDGQGDLAGHGGEHRAVFVYQLDSYRHWQERLKRDDFVYGQFGENFTVEGLADDTACIGDRYQIGSALFEIMQPRVTCYRAGHSHEQPHARIADGQWSARFPPRAPKAKSVLEDEIVRSGEAKGGDSRRRQRFSIRQSPRDRLSAH